MIGIYKFTFSNNHYYIGQLLNIKRREQQHCRDMLKNKHPNSRVQNCFNKYGNPNFEILEECSIDVLNEKETFYISQYIKDVNCCNVCLFGKNRIGTTQPESAKILISNYQHLSGKVKPVYMFSRDENFMLAKFSSIKEAEKAIDCHPKDVQKSCKSNGRYNVQKYKFRYALPVDNFLNYIKDLVPF